MKKKITILVILSLIINISMLGIMTDMTKAEDVDYEEEWNIPDDGSEDSSNYYNITRIDNNASATIHIKAWISNRTISITFDNIEEVEIYLEETDINLEEYKSYLNALDNNIKILLSSEQSVEISFTITGIPEFASAELDGEEWNEYNYNDETNSMNFSLNMSTHEITLNFDGWLLDLFLGVFSILIVIKVFQIIIGQFKNMEEEMK